jgi:hypothetical protein
MSEWGEAMDYVRTCGVFSTDDGCGSSGTGSAIPEL